MKDHTHVYLNCGERYEAVILWYPIGMTITDMQALREVDQLRC